MEAHGNNSNNSFTALNLGGSGVVDSLLQMHQQNVRTDNVDIVNAAVTEAVVENQPQVNSRFSNAAEDGSGSSLSGTIEAGGSSSYPNEQNEAPRETTSVLGSGGVTINEPSPPSSTANEAATGVEASHETTGVPAENSSEAVRREDEAMEYEIYEALVAANARYWSPVDSFSEGQPIVPQSSQGDGNPSPPDSPNYSPPEPSSPSSTLTARSSSDYWPPNPTPPRLRILSDSIPGDATMRNFPLALPPYRPSSSFTDPFSPSQFPEYALSYIRELEERFHDEGTMDDGYVNLFYNDDTVENASGEAPVVHPITGRSADTSRYHPYEISPTIRSLARRARILSQVTHHMENGLRNSILRRVQRSPLHRLPEEMPEANGDLFVNVDEMTYEQLLELEERIGIVPRGLREETIAAHLNRHYFHSPNNESSTDHDSGASQSCCICQEEYVDGEELARLACIHKFHYECIKQWLMLKNQCPLCKLIGLRV